MRINLHFLLFGESGGVRASLNFLLFAQCGDVSTSLNFLLFHPLVTAASSRIATLDLVRGVAVMGILAANIAAFGLPEPAYFSPTGFGAYTRADLIAWAATFVLVEGKMRGLFSFLFGASMLLVIDRAGAAGDSPASVHYSRMAWLFAFGMVHLYLFWWGDILTHYAIVGAVAYAFHRLPTRTLVAAGLLCVATQFVLFARIGADLFVLSAAAHTPGAAAATVTQWRNYASAFGSPTHAQIAAELAATHGGFLTMLRWRIATNVDPLSFALIGGAETLGYMLLGMAGLRSGFLTGAWPRKRYRFIALLTLGLALPAYAAIALFDIAHGFDPRWVFVSSLILSAPLRPVMVVGYAALVILLARPSGWLTERIAAAGRLAFSNYLGTTLICTTMFYGYGFDLFGRLGRAQLYWVVALLWLVMLLWSSAWLARFRYGPLEWLWRSAARLEWQPMRKKS